MLQRGFNSVFATWFAGLLALLPLALTAAVLAWVLKLIYEYFGPRSLVGQLFAALGYPFSNNPALAYIFGTLVLVAAIYLLGLVVSFGLKGPLKKLTDRTLRHIPIVGGLYNLADRFVGLLDQKPGSDIAAMRPVWCRFGGDGVAVLALAPSAEPIDINGSSFFAVLVPTAPVPFGGALLYVPAAWIWSANIGVDKLMAVYVSMGITPPIAPANTPDVSRKKSSATDW